MKTRRVLVQIHLWLGLTVGALWAIQGLTGATLVFNRDIQPLLLSRPVAATQSALPLDTIFQAASAAAGARVERVENFTPDPTLLTAYYENASGEMRTLVMDARTGAVIDHRNPEPSVPTGGSIWKWLLHFHESLLSGDTGLIFIGTSGILLFSSLVLGFVIAWPKRRAWKPVFRVNRWNNTTQKLFGWHRMLGLTIGALMLVSAASGTYLALAPTLRPMLVSATGFRPGFKPRPVDELAPPTLTAQQALDAARKHFINAVLARATLPTAKSPAYGFRLLQAGEGRRWAGTTTVFIDPADGHALDIYDPLNAPLANRVTDLLYPVHTGEIGGAIARILMMLGGLTLPTLYVTGVWAWLRSRQRRSKKRPASVTAFTVG